MRLFELSPCPHCKGLGFVYLGALLGEGEGIDGHLHLYDLCPCHHGKPERVSVTIPTSPYARRRRYRLARQCLGTPGFELFAKR